MDMRVPASRYDMLLLSDAGEFAVRRADAPGDASAYRIFLSGSCSWAQGGEWHARLDTQQMQPLCGVGSSIFRALLRRNCLGVRL
jgi:hypothetical protein